MANVKWPHMREEDQWLTGAMEQRLQESKQSVEELQARARELRVEAEASDIRGIRAASNALAECYEQAAAARLAA